MTMPRKKAETVLTDEVLRKIHELALKQVSAQDIANSLSIDISYVYKALSEKFPHLKDLRLFTDNKTDVFRSIQSKAAEWILQKIPLASVKDLTYLLAILEDKINLREGRATQHIGIGIRIEHLVSQKEKLIEKLRQDGVPEHLIDIKLKEMLRLPDNATIPLHEVLPIKADTPTPPD